MANLTSKELGAIEDQLAVEQNLIKKYQAYAQQATDPQIKTQCEQIANEHQQHLNCLISHLN